MHWTAAATPERCAVSQGEQVRGRQKRVTAGVCAARTVWVAACSKRGALTTHGLTHHTRPAQPTSQPASSHNKMHACTHRSNKMLRVRQLETLLPLSTDGPAAAAHTAHKTHKTERGKPPTQSSAAVAAQSKPLLTPAQRPRAAHAPTVSTGAMRVRQARHSITQPRSACADVQHSGRQRTAAKPVSKTHQALCDTGQPPAQLGFLGFISPATHPHLQAPVPGSSPSPTSSDRHNPAVQPHSPATGTSSSTPVLPGYTAANNITLPRVPGGSLVLLCAWEQHRTTQLCLPIHTHPRGCVSAAPHPAHCPRWSGRALCCCRRWG